MRAHRVPILGASASKCRGVCLDSDAPRGASAQTKKSLVRFEFRHGPPQAPLFATTREAKYSRVQAENTLDLTWIRSMVKKDPASKDIFLPRLGNSMSHRRGHFNNHSLIAKEDDAVPTEDKGNQMSAKETRRLMALDVGRFFVENGIPFNVAHSPSYYQEVATPDAIVDHVTKTWAQIGVSILSDGWKDIRGRSLINFLVNKPYGTEKIGSLPQHKNALLKAKKSTIDQKWEFQMYRHLHASAYSLKPYFQYDDGFSTHVEVNRVSTRAWRN
ncbi:hypothetical protein PHJA_002143600 [Phtheirospermum japonicum]|uniref:DUF659 domain-containing protein n=1 Tax=Phtheirospermum japonicum TaxID=374723 RepID=A0A830CY36_9LAMI|nr:hypothetical protein PHJA_002143600 [Phtheirospermum japonicum]